MSNRQIVLLVVILALIVVAVWVILPVNAGILGKPAQFQLGLDLVGGVQALLEADLPCRDSGIGGIDEHRPVNRGQPSQWPRSN